LFAIQSCNSISEEPPTSSHSFNSLFETVYETLRQIARAQMKHERVNHTLQATAVVNEAYMRLIDQHQLKAADRNAFLAAVIGRAKPARSGRVENRPF
jgi:hypothetical protein